MSRLKPAINRLLHSRCSPLNGSTRSIQDGGARALRPALSAAGVRKRFYRAISEARLRRTIKVKLKSELFTCSTDAQELVLAFTMDYKLSLVTKVSDLRAEAVVAR